MEILANLPTRPKSIRLKTNFFQVKFSSPIYRMDLIFDPDEMRTNQSTFIKLMREFRPILKEKLISFLLRDNIVYSTTASENDIEFETKFEEINVKITCLRTGILSQSAESEHSNIMGRLIKISQKELGLKMINRKYFNPLKRQDYPNYKFSVWPGYSTSLKFFDGSYNLNIDLSFKVLQSELVYDWILGLRNRNKTKEFIKSELFGKIIVTRYNNLTYRIDDIDFNMTPEDTFLKENGDSISYMQYYSIKYGRNIIHKDQPLLVSIDKKSEKRFYLIPELCSRTGFTDVQKTNRNIMKDISGFMKPNPQERIEKSRNLIRDLRCQQESNSSLQPWNMLFNTNTKEINGKVVLAGDLEMGFRDQRNENLGRIVIPIGPNMSREIQKSMHTQVEINFWGIMCPESCEREFVKLRDHLQKYIRETINYPVISPPAFIKIPKNSWHTKLREVPLNCQFVVCIQSDNDGSDVYKDIKNILTAEKGIPTQCIKANTINRSNIVSIISNLFNQIACKVGGTPWVVRNIPFSSDNRTLIFGIDVYHDTKRNRKSVFAIVASANRNFTSFWSKCYYHSPGEEFGFRVQEGFTEALSVFKGRTGSLPQQIIIYRDGVTESQIRAIKSIEIGAIERAISSFSVDTSNPKDNLQIKIIYICVNKICALKLFLADDLRNPDSIRNPDQGTVVDGLGNSFDHFYLISQRTTQGTATPSHYIFVRNDLITELSTQAEKEEIIYKFQTLSYQLCYQYFNWIGAIKVPAPIQLAHKLAEFVGTFIDERNLLNPKLGEKRSLFFM